MISYLLIAITCILSYKGFQDRAFFDKLSFNAYAVAHRKEYYRLFTNGFVHADGTHLLMNMMVLYFFGKSQEAVFNACFYGDLLSGWLVYLLLYLLALPASCLPSLLAHKDNPYYSAVGASGAVNAVIFSHILIFPLSNIYIFFAIPIKAILFAGLYLAYSWYMAKQNRDLIGHDAHVSGAFFGLIFTIATIPGVLRHFFSQLFD